MQGEAEETAELGAFAADGWVTFRAWSTSASSVAARVVDEAGALVAEHPLEHRGGGLHEGRVRLALGAFYMLRLDGRVVPDPYARWLPRGVHGPAQVMARETCPGGHVSEPGAWVIYELHVGTFTAEGTYAAAAERLPALVELGVTAIELLPLASFPGRRGWGYDGVGLFAPFAGYGTPAELRALVARAHALGLFVLLDVVYNHLGPEGNYLAAYSREYFREGAWTAWGQALDFTCPWLRRLVLDNARMWLCEYGLDGLRLDATQAIADPSPVHIVAELAAMVRGLPGRRVLIAEDGLQRPSVVTRWGADGLWADDFHHAVHRMVTGERDGYYAEYAGSAVELARIARRGLLYEGQPWLFCRQIRGEPAGELRPEWCVVCLQNHDQVGNRALGERLDALVEEEVSRALAVLLLFLPTTPMLWMGQEWAASTPWLYFTDHPPELGRRVAEGRRAEYRDFARFADRLFEIPDPQAEATFRASVLRWEEREVGRHAAMLALYTALLRLRREDPVLRGSSVLSSGTDDAGRLWVRREGAGGERLCVVDVRGWSDPAPPAACAGGWERVLGTRGAGVYRRG